MHYCAQGGVDPYWSITRFDDIVAVEENPAVFSSEPTVSIIDPHPKSLFQGAVFIAMDGPQHTEHRKVVQPVSSPRNL